MGYRVSVYNLSGQIEQQFELQQGAVTLGRATDASVRLMSASVSRHHARLHVAGGQLRIMDLNSSNGVRVNGVRIQGEAPVPVGGTVTMGDFTLRIESSTAAHRQPVAGSGTGPAPAWAQSPPSQARGAVYPPSGPSGPGPASAPHPVRPEATTAPPRRAPTRIPRATDPPLPHLVRFGDEHAGQRFALSTPQIAIGRGMSNAVQLLHPSVSRVHAHLSQQGDTWIVSDAGSANGTRVNGTRVDAPTVVREGDVVQVGDLYVVLTSAPDRVELQRLARQWAHAASGGSSNNRTLMLLGALLLVLLALAAVLVVAMKLRGGDASSTTTASANATTSDSDTVSASTLAARGEWRDALAALDDDEDVDAEVATQIRAEVAALDALDTCREQVGEAQELEASGANRPAADAWTTALACLDAVEETTDAGDSADRLATDTAAPALIGLHRAGGAAALQAREFDDAIERFAAARDVWAARPDLGDPPSDLADALRRAHIFAGDASFSDEAWADAVTHYEAAHEIEALDEARVARLESAQRRAE